ncbi:serine protease [Limnohabitans sp. Hippo4]|uniref:trypsin-like peptidase domain-containing protein n=1 Tax=Limnohabitans sp. Hippo4 TaxID=1826167 RepID=UPI000D362508|nr:serine protease [Limnohabitans sp. Hippo4]PUE35516.1 serine protease [Limnohabitans sp. Hippo4]
MQVDTIAEQLFFTTTRIDTVAPDGTSGSGTGFFFQYVVDEITYPFIVTNKHVVMGMRNGSLTFLKQKDGRPELGNGFTLQVGADDWAKMWFGHREPDVDIVISAFAPMQQYIKDHHGIDLFFRSVDKAIVPTQQQIDELDAVEDVTFIGYPNGVWDAKNLLPVARRGTTATPIAVDFENTPRFLIDASVFGGSSGSPVFVLNQGSWAAKNGGLVAGSRLIFIGVVAAVFYRTHLNQIVPVPIPTQVRPMAEQQEMIDLGIVFKARTVVETVEDFLKANGLGVTEA